MGTLLTILVVLFLALIIVVPLIEKYAPKSDSRDLSGITRWIFPLLALLIGIQIVRYYFM